MKYLRRTIFLLGIIFLSNLISASTYIDNFNITTTGNTTSDWFFGKLNWSFIQNVPSFILTELDPTLWNSIFNSTGDSRWLDENSSFNQSFTNTLYYSISNPLGFISSYVETDPLFIAENSSLWNEAKNKYNSTYHTTSNEWNGNKSALLGCINNASYLASDGTGGWTNTSTETNTSLRVNANGGIKSTNYTIGTSTLNSTVFGNLVGLNQPLTKASSPTFIDLTATNHRMGSSGAYLSGDSDTITIKEGISDVTSITLQLTQAGGADGQNPTISCAGECNFTSNVQQKMVGIGTAPSTDARLYVYDNRDIEYESQSTLLVERDSTTPIDDLGDGIEFYVIKLDANPSNTYTNPSFGGSGQSFIPFYGIAQDSRKFQGQVDGAGSYAITMKGISFTTNSLASINFSKSRTTISNYGAYITTSFTPQTRNETTNISAKVQNYFTHTWNPNIVKTPTWVDTEMGLESNLLTTPNEGLKLSYGFKCTNDNDATTDLCFYSATNTPSYFGGDNTWIGLGNNYTNPSAMIYFDGANLIFNTTAKNSSANAWFSRNVSATGFITRTSTYNKNDGDALDNIFDSDYYLLNGELEHSKFYGYTTYEVSDPENCHEEVYMTKYCYTFKIPKNSTTIDEEGKTVIEYETKSECFDEELTNARTLRYVEESNVEEYTKTVCGTKLEEGVLLDKEVNLIKQGIAEYRTASDVKQIQGEGYTSPAFDTTTILTEAILTKSKVPDDSTDYISKLKDKSKLTNKETHYAKKNINVEGVDTTLLDMEERVVVLEGAMNQILMEMCEKQPNQWSWCEKR